VLAGVEARRALRGPAFWIGVLVSGLVLVEARGIDWQGGAYETFVVGFLPIAAGIFVCGILSGARDRRRDGGASLAEEAPLGATERAAARLLGLVPLVLAASLAVVAVAVAIRIEGGLWIGNRPGRTDAAVHGVAEVLGPILMFLLAGAAGVALGRVVRRRTTGVLIGVVAFFLLTSLYWVWQFHPFVYVTPVQTQPISVPIEGPATDPSVLPADWLLDRPGDPADEPGDEEWARIVVDRGLAAWHDVYVVGLALGAIGLALRTRVGRRLALGGLLIAALGVAGQVSVMPEGARQNEVPQ
jgi:hypothetical protein